MTSDQDLTLQVAHDAVSSQGMVLGSNLGFQCRKEYLNNSTKSKGMIFMDEDGIIKDKNEESL